MLRIESLFSLMVTIPTSSTQTIPSNSSEISVFVEHELRRNGFDRTKSINYLASQKSDFTELNKILQDTEISLPDDEILIDDRFFDPFNLFEGSLIIQDFSCNLFGINDINFNHAMVDPQTANLKIDLMGFAVTCKLKWDIGLRDPPLASISGEVFTEIVDSAFSTDIDFKSDNFNNFGPTDLDIKSCETDLNFKTLEIDGNIAVDLVGVLTNFFRRFIAMSVNTQVCEALKESGVSNMKSALQTLNDDTLVWASMDINPLLLQDTFDDSVASTFIDYTDNTCVFSGKFINFTEKTSCQLGHMSYDPYGVDDESEDLGINILARAKVLNTDRLLNITFPDGVKVFTGHGASTNIDVSINAVRVSGLDSFSSIKLLDILSPQTLQSSFTVRDINLEADFMVVLGSTEIPTSENDCIEILVPPRVESVTFLTSIKDLFSQVSIFVGLNNELVKGLKLYAFMYQACSLEFISLLSITALIIEYTDLDIKVQGLISPGLDYIVFEGVKAMFDMYAGSNTLPLYIRTDLKESINNETQNLLESFSQNSCPKYEISTSQAFIDFRDLFSNHTGTLPYGDTVPSISQYFHDVWNVDENESFTFVNDMIGRLTRLISNSTGSLQIQPTLSCETSFFTPFDFRADFTHLYIENMDSVGEVIQILQPNEENPHQLDNKISIGVGEHPIQIGARLALSLSGDNLQAYNDVNITIELKDFHVMASILAKVNEEAFMEYPLADILNPFCMLATVAGPDIRGQIGITPQHYEYPFLNIFDLKLQSNEVNIKAECISCNSLSFAEIPKVIETLGSEGIIEEIFSLMWPFIEEIVETPEVELTLNNAINLASSLCPHDPLYDSEIGLTPMFPFSTFECLDVTKLPIPSLSKSTLEVVMLILAVFSHAALATMPLSPLFMPEKEEFSDPFSSQHFFDESNVNETLINFQEIEFLNEVNPFIDSWSNSVFDVGVNVLISTFLLDDSGLLTVSNTMLDTIRLGEVNLTINSINIAGLDSFYELSVVEAIAPQTLQSSFKLGKMQIDTDIGVKYYDRGSNGLISDVTTVSLGLRDIEGTFSVFLPILEEKVLNLNIGSLLFSDRILPCYFSTIYDMNLTQMDIIVGGIDYLTLSGFVSNKIKSAIEKSSNSILTAHGIQSEGLSLFLSSIVLDSINDIIQQSWRDNMLCPENIHKNNHEFVDMRDLILSPAKSVAAGGSGTMPYGDVVFRVMDFVKERLFSPGRNGLPKINTDFIEPITKFQSNSRGDFFFPGIIFNSSYMLESFGNQTASNTLFNLQVLNLKVENLNSVGYPIEILEPQTQEPYWIKNEAILGVGNDPFRVAGEILLDISNRNTRTINNLIITLEFEGLNFLLSLISKINQELLITFPLSSITNTSCWLAMIPPIELDEFGVRLKETEPNVKLINYGLSMTKLGVNVECINCTSPLFYSLNEKLSMSGSVERMQVLLFSMMIYLENPQIRQFVQFVLDRATTEAVYECPHLNASGTVSGQVPLYSSFKTPSNGSTAVEQLVMAVAIIVSIIGTSKILQIIQHRILQRKRRKFLATLTEEEIIFLYVEKNNEEMKQRKLCLETKSMMQSNIVPTVVRYSMPFVICLNIWLFYSGHVNLAGSVDIYIGIAGEMNAITRFYTFNVIQAVQEMWISGFWILSIVLFLFSIIWPYVKQLITLVAWCLPPSRMSVKRRGEIFRKLDALGKWSMLDIYTLIMFMAVFSVKANSPNGSVMVPDNFFLLNVLLDILWGCYANMIAQVISQISSHFIVHYHEKIIAAWEKQISSTSETSDESEDDTSSERTVSHVFQNKVTKENMDKAQPLCRSSFMLCCQKVQVLGSIRPGTNFIFALYGLTMLAIFCTGLTLPTFKFKMVGLGGIVVAPIKEGKTTVIFYNIFSLAKLILDQAEFLPTSWNYIGLGFLVFLTSFSTVVVGLILICLIFSLWFVPMSTKSKKRLKVGIEVFQSWQYVDVYLLSILIGLSQIGAMVESMASGWCSQYDDIFKILTYFEILSEVDARCFFLITDIEAGFYVLLVFTFMLAFAKHFVLFALEQHLSDLESNPTIWNDKVSSCMRSRDDFIDYEGATQQVISSPWRFSDRYRWLLKPVTSFIAS